MAKTNTTNPHKNRDMRKSRRRRNMNCLAGNRQLDAAARHEVRFVAYEGTTVVATFARRDYLVLMNFARAKSGKAPLRAVKVHDNPAVANGLPISDHCTILRNNMPVATLATQSEAIDLVWLIAEAEQGVVHRPAYLEVIDTQGRVQEYYEVLPLPQKPAPAVVPEPAPEQAPQLQRAA